MVHHQTFFALTQGVYATRQGAESEAKIYQSQLGLKPWIRPLDSFNPI